MGAGAVRAAPDKREVEARADFAAGRYQHAIDIFAQLYGETLNPIYLRNIGRCQQNLNQPQAAINAFREYLRKEKVMTAAERVEIEGYIKEMEAQLASRPAAPAPAPAPLATGAPPAPANATPSPVVPAVPSVPTGVPAAASEEAPSVAASTGGVAPARPAPATGPVLTISVPPPASHVEHPWRTAGVVTACVGGALIVTGVILGLSARSDANAVSAAYDPSQADAGKRNARIGVAADIVGAVAVVTGVLLATHETPVTSPSAVSLRAGAATDLRSGLLLLGGTF